MGRHASAERRRSVAAWPIIVGVVVLLIVVATVGYIQLTRDDDTAACSGTTVLPVVAAPGAAAAIEQAARAFNATKPEARSTCVSVTVTRIAGPAAVTALAGGWRSQGTPAPGLWIADSAADVAALDAADPAMTAGHPTQGLASSPVVLAVRQAPGRTPSWSALAAGSGGLLLGLGDPGTDRASAAALQSLVRGASGTPAVGTAIDTATVTAAEPALARLAGASSGVPATTELALVALAGGRTGYTAVPVVESDLAAFNAGKDTPLTAVYPTGPTAGIEVMPVPLTAAWVSNAMSDAAAAFDGYLGDAAGTTVLTAAHLRTPAAPAAAAGVDLGKPVSPLPEASTATGAALAAAWKAAGAGSAPASSMPSTGPVPTSPVGTPTGTAPGPTGSAVSSPGTAVSTTGAAVSSTGPAVSTSATAAPRTTAASPPVPTTTSVAATSSAVGSGVAIEFLVDTSGSMTTMDDGAKRLTWATSAISTVMQQRPGSSFGLTTFATTTTEAVPIGPLGTSIDGMPRSSAIVAALNDVTPAGDSHTYGALRTAFADAANDAVLPGSPHRVILLTDGGDSTPGLSRDSIKATVATLVSQHPGLVLDIVGLSSSVNEQALTEIAAAGGGTFTPVDALSGLGATLLSLSS